MEYTRTPQKPVNSGFSRKTTAADVIKGVDLSGKNVIITGGYSGLGLATARALLSAGANVIMPVRNAKKAGETLKGLNVETFEANLSDPISIDVFAEWFLSTQRPLHLLINNAGIMAPPLTRDKDGNEIQLSTNHLGHFRLTSRLFEALVKAAYECQSGAKIAKDVFGDDAYFFENDVDKKISSFGNPFSVRVITLSSRAHRRSAFNFSDPNYLQTAYDPWKAYGQSKTANCLFAVELDKRAARYGIRSFAVHPGLIPTTNINSAKIKNKARLYRTAINFGVKALNALRFPLIFTAIRRLLPSRRGNELKTIEQGAATTIFCATSPLLRDMGGVYCEDCDVAEIQPEASKAAFGVRPYAIDADASKRLWEMSEKLTGLKFDI